jgi:hypothetical protein
MFAVILTSEFTGSTGVVVGFSVPSMQLAKLSAIARIRTLADLKFFILIYLKVVLLV